MKHKLLVAKSYYGINTHGPSGRQVRSNESRCQEEKRHTGNGRAIYQVNSVKYAAQQVRDRCGEKDSDKQAGEERSFWNSFSLLITLLSFPLV